MNIDSIKNGYVLDHITAGKAMKIYELLELNKLECQVAIITNARSNKYGKKDMIKIDKLIDIDLDIIGYIDPRTTICIVKNDKIIEKKTLSKPKELINVVSCKNPRCITSVERGLDQIFVLKENNRYRCKYCETILEQE